MTIIFQGHVDRVELAHVGKIKVTIVPPVAVCEETIELLIDKQHASEWLVGMAVDVRAFAFDPKNPPVMPADHK